MEKKDKKIYCGRCRKGYSKKQNWDKHFDLQTVKKDVGQGQGSIFVANVCFKTTGPKVWDHNLDTAVQKYKNAQKQQQSASNFFKADPTPKSATSTSGAPTPARQIETLSEAEIEISSTPPSSPCKKKKLNETTSLEEILTSSENTLVTPAMKNTLDMILRCTKETLDVVTQNNQLLNRSASAASTSASASVASTSTTCSTSCTTQTQDKNLKSKQFDVQIASLDKAKSIDDILKNDLIKNHFKLIEKEHIQTQSDNPSETLPKDVIENIASSDITMPDMDSDDSSDNDGMEPIEATTFCLYCIPCTDKKVCSTSKHSKRVGTYSVKDANYCCKKGDKQERWFLNLKHLLKTHLGRLQHHQKAAIHDVMISSSEKIYTKIEDICSNILYFIMKTNTAWALYPVLLAVLYRSGHEVGNINHSRYACQQMCVLLNEELKVESKKWFDEQKSVTLTADVGTILGLSMLVVLLESESDKTVKLAGINLISSKSGKYLANEIFEILKSPNHLNLSETDIKLKVSGMAGDGAFCKENEPFKSEMKLLFGDHFKFRWDILHLVNRAHSDALNKTCELTELLDFIQCHSSNLRTGLAYTGMVIGNVIGFKRPKLKSETRMVNFEFDQCDRFINNAKFFDHPQDKLLSVQCYILICLTTKVILQVAQKTTVTSEFMENIIYKEGGKKIMIKVLEILSGDNIIENVNQIDLSESHEDYILGEVLKYVRKNADIFEIDESKRPTRTRKEGSVDNQSVLTWVKKYVNLLWEGISKRLQYFDSDGTTNWSEAPAEGVFSILGYIIEHKPSLTVENMVSLCRIVKEGPAPGTPGATEIAKRAVSKWPGVTRDRGTFITNKYMKRVTSTTVINAMKKDQ